MKFLGIKFFKSPSATGHVFFLKGGKEKDMGVAHSGLISPWTTVAVVPTTTHTLDFQVKARSKDKQGITVTGNIKIKLEPKIAVKKFDFGMDVNTGSYVSEQWKQELKAVVVERVFAPVLKTAQDKDVVDLMTANSDFEQKINDSFSATATPSTGTNAGRKATVTLSEYGITLESCSVTKIDPDDRQVAETIGANEKQVMITAADKALHDRQMKAEESTRRLEKYKADTELELEQKKKDLITEQNANNKLLAEGDRDNTKTRLDGYKDVDSGKLLGASLFTAAGSGSITTVSIVPELAAAIKGSNS